MERKLLALFTSRVRIKILGLLLLSDKELYVRQICRIIGEEINAVRRELGRLVAVGLLKSKQRGNRLFYKARKEFVFYPEIIRLVAKTTRLGKRIIERREELGSIKYAMMALPFVEGRVASERQVDLLIVGRVKLRLLEELIQTAEKEDGRQINYSVMTVEEFNFRKKRRDSFVLKILSQPQIMLIGDEQSFNLMSP